MFATVCWVTTAGKGDNYECSKVYSQIVGGRTSGTEKNCGRAYGTSKHCSSSLGNLGAPDHWYLAGALLAANSCLTRGRCVQRDRSPELLDDPIRQPPMVRMRICDRFGRCGSIPGGHAPRLAANEIISEEGREHWQNDCCFASALTPMARSPLRRRLGRCHPRTPG
jgi:hypothetical protein